MVSLFQLWAKMVELACSSMLSYCQWVFATIIIDYTKVGGVSTFEEDSHE